MRIAVMGTGGVGGYFGGKLAAVGHDVAFIARGAQLVALQRDGLVLSGPRGEVHLPEVTASDRPADIGPVDAVLFCVKLYDTEAAGRQIAPLLAEGGFVVSLQNGVDGPERLARIVAPEAVMGGAAYVSARIEAPGRIAYASAMSGIAFGTLDGREDVRLPAFRDACREAGFGADIAGDIAATLWSKFVLLATNAGLTCLARQPVATIYADPDLRRLALAAMAEIVALAKAKGVKVPADVIDKAVALSDGFPAGMTTSTHHDLNAGRRLELESLSGYVAREADRLGVEAPIHRACWAALKPYLDGR